MLQIVIWVVIILIFLAFKEQIMQAIAFTALMAGIGAFVFWILFDNASLGANVGIGLTCLIGLKWVADTFGARYPTVFGNIYYLVSSIFWIPNRLQHILSEPWRYMFKTNWLSDDTKEVVRPFLYFVQILLYIAITPLRLLNAIAYNMVVYTITELYDLFLEVLHPCDEEEGAGDFWGWLLMFPVRLAKYPVFHGSLVIIESVVWTIADIFIPTVTMYHGTDLTAAQAITGSSKRNAYLGNPFNAITGTFRSSTNGWGGRGVYFGSSRRTAHGYAVDPYRLSDNEPVMIVCRVSLGKILNYALSPDHIYNNTGEYGNHGIPNGYARENGYKTGEWWNAKHSYWEFCMFDWQNLYNHPWRIRPIYVYNFNTGRAQHIEGGIRHWLFDETVFLDVIKSIEENLFQFLVGVFIVFFTFWFLWKMYKLDRINFDSLHLMEFVDKKSPVIQEIRTIQQEEFSEPPQQPQVPSNYQSQPKRPSQTLINEKPKESRKPISVQQSSKNQYNYHRHTETGKKSSSRPEPQSKPQYGHETTSQHEQNSNGTGFKLERVNHIPEPATSSQSGTGFHLEKIE